MEISLFSSPVKVYGIPFFEKTHRLERLPEEVRKKIGSHIEHFGRRCPGARMEFKTNSEKIKVKVLFETLAFDIGMSVFSCQSAYVYIGDHTCSRYAGHVYPHGCYVEKEATAEFTKSGELENIQIFFPRNEVIRDILVELDDSAAVLPPDPYKTEKPILFYGSSITEGGCCSKIANAYSSILSRRLDADFYNLGFSGCARGEECMAEYINTIDKCLFVYDYDHNAPDAEHLRKTHEPFFLKIREASPSLPVLMLTMPPFAGGETQERRDIIYATYQNALARGDQNVYFIDGQDYFPPESLVFCTNDNVHPNDLGMFFMANAIQPTVEKLLKL